MTYQYLKLTIVLLNIRSSNYQPLLDPTHDYRTTKTRDDKKLSDITGHDGRPIPLFMGPSHLLLSWVGREF